MSSLMAQAMREMRLDQEELKDDAISGNVNEQPVPAGGPVSTPLLSARTEDSGSAPGQAPITESAMTTEDTPPTESQNYRFDMV